MQQCDKKTFVFLHIFVAFVWNYTPTDYTEMHGIAPPTQ